MYEHLTTIRVRYAETDQMGIVYYGNYAQYFEVGRAESIRNLGFTYKKMEEIGIKMPVVNMEVKFIRSAMYDDLITVKTILKEVPTDHSITFFSEVYNEMNKLLTTGVVTLYFLDASTGKKIGLPDALKNVLQPFFSED